MAATRKTKTAGILEDDPLWYKDGVIYQLHVRSFFDSDGDGIGDFRGLTEKLDYLQDLGVTALWLLPFYPSPLRDDGYDIADYTEVNSTYGSLQDFKIFLERSTPSRPARNHRTGGEPHLGSAPLVPALTQRAGRSNAAELLRLERHRRKSTRKRESSSRTSSSRTGPGTRSPAPTTGIASTRHQPDLNFDNPQVKKALFEVLDFWMEMGVDGLRLDAVPYLYEREGTTARTCRRPTSSSKELRSHVDQHFRNRMLLAEANQWPEDAGPISADGDECHVAFHFPLMPRLFMSLRRRIVFRSSTSCSRPRRFPRIVSGRSFCETTTS